MTFSQAIELAKVDDIVRSMIMFRSIIKVKVDDRGQVDDRERT